MDAYFSPQQIYFAIPDICRKFFFRHFQSFVGNVHRVCPTKERTVCVLSTGISSAFEVTVRM